MVPKSNRYSSYLAGAHGAVHDVFHGRFTESIVEMAVEPKRLGRRLGRAYWENPAYLKKLREEAGLSQHALARIAKISRSVIANYETGVTTPSIGNAFEICRVLRDLGSERAAKTLVDVARHMKEFLISVRKLLDAEADKLNRDRDVVRKQLAVIERWLALRKKHGR